MIAEPTTAEVDEALRHATRAAGTELHGWRVRSVHRRGATTVSVVVETDLTDAEGRDRTLLYVVHRSTRQVPTGAAVVELPGGTAHVWRFPDDPYVPGLRDAVSRRRARARLERLGRSSRRPAIHTRSYRPSRRAVVAVRAAGDEPPALYLKLLGGRDATRVHDRAAALAAVHDHLVDHLPVPQVLERDLASGTVTLAAMEGRTLRASLRAGDEIPPVADVADLVARIGAAPPPPGDGDPARFADVSRHVTLLSSVLPARAADLERIATAVADVDGPVGTLHGDLHDGQLLVVDGRVTGLLDVDGAGTGALALDAGRLVANVEVAGVTAPGQRGRVDRWAAELATALATTVPEDDLARAAAAAWLGLATGPHRVRGEGWQHATGERLDRALAWVDRIG